MMHRRCPVVALAGLLIAVGAWPADAHWFGFAFDAVTAARSRCFVTRPGGGRGFRIVGPDVTATLVCGRGGGCNGRRGRIAGVLAPTAPERLTGTLTYARGALVCSLECEVTALPSQPSRSFWSCLYDCPSPARVRIGTFSIQRR